MTIYKISSHGANLAAESVDQIGLDRFVTTELFVRVRDSVFEAMGIMESEEDHTSAYSELADAMMTAFYDCLLENGEASFSLDKGSVCLGQIDHSIGERYITVRIA